MCHFSSKIIRKASQSFVFHTHFLFALCTEECKFAFDFDHRKENFANFKLCHFHCEKMALSRPVMSCFDEETFPQKNAHTYFRIALKMCKSGNGKNPMWRCKILLVNPCAVLQCCASQIAMVIFPCGSFDFCKQEVVVTVCFGMPHTLQLH